jgi:hypothetical protein
MKAYTATTVVEACEDRWQAQNAVDELQRAGFREDQIAVAAQEESRPGDRIQKTLVNLGLSQKEAAYYCEKFKAGRTLVVVEAERRDRLAQTILRRYRSHTVHLKMAQEVSFDVAQGPHLVAPGDNLDVKRN